VSVPSTACAASSAGLERDVEWAHFEFARINIAVIKVVQWKRCVNQKCRLDVQDLASETLVVSMTARGIRSAS
jgi:hypothetical protein